MNKWQKQTIITVLTGLLGVILILGVVLVATKEHRFNKYINKQSGFDMGYPATWTYQEDAGGATVIFLSPQENDLDFFRESVNIVVQDLTGNPMTLKNYSETAIRQMEIVFEENFVLLESGPATVSGLPAYKIVFIGKGPDTELKYKSVWTIKDVTAYQITYTALATQYDKYIAKMDRMVRTFRIY